MQPDMEDASGQKEEAGSRDVGVGGGEMEVRYSAAVWSSGLSPSSPIFPLPDCSSSHL